MQDVSTHIHMCRPILVKKGVWVDTWPSCIDTYWVQVTKQRLERTMSRHIRISHRCKKVYESTHPIMCRHILNRFHKTEAGKAYESIHTRFASIQEDAWVDTSHYVSTHTELILFYRSRRSYVSMHSSMGRHIAVQKCIFPLFCTVFTFFYYHSIWL